MSAKEVYACVYIKILNEFQLLVLCNSVTRRLAASAEAQGGLEKIRIFQIQIFTRARAQPGSHAAKSPLRDAKDLEGSDQHSRDSFMQWLIIVMIVLCSKHKGGAI